MITIKGAGDAALLLQVSQPVQASHQGGNAAASIAAAIRAADVPGVIDVVPGALTVLVTFRPGALRPCAERARDKLTRDELASALVRIAGQASATTAGPTEGPVVIDTVYDGPDLTELAALTGLTTGEVVARHQAAEYRVGWLGFSPGFGYLTGLDPRLAVPRLDTPRLSVPAGSVAIAGGLAAVYPAACPGGWRLLGRSAAILWDPGRNPPALLVPGQRVRFRAVSRLPDLEAPHVRDSDRPDDDQSAGQRQEIREMPGGRCVEVVRPGPLTTIQDLGRRGLAHLGVPGSGAADVGSLRLANERVGNDANAACLEVTLGRLELYFHFDAVVAVTGAPAPVRLTGPGAGSQSGPGARLDLAGDRSRPAEPGPAHATAFAVPAGTALRLDPPATGLRSYLAIGGGIDLAPVLGSRSADLHSGLGPPPLRAGQVLPVGHARSRSGNGQAQPAHAAGPASAARRPGAGAHQELRVLPGPRDDWFAGTALTALTTESYEVTTASNRSGLRLAGPRLRRARSEELPSEGMVAGSLQVSHDGQPILLLADHPTTGGYPVIAVVASADLDAAAQLRPGQRVRFRLVDG